MTICSEVHIIGVSNLFAMPVSVLWVVGLDKKQVTNKKLGCEKIFLFQGHIVSTIGDGVRRVAISSLSHIFAAAHVSFMGRGSDTK
jgi:hypothetical protein